MVEVALNGTFELHESTWTAEPRPSRRLFECHCRGNAQGLRKLRRDAHPGARDTDQEEFDLFLRVSRYRKTLIELAPVCIGAAVARQGMPLWPSR